MKYILTENTRKVGGKTLYQIQAVRSFSNVKEGDLGGWIEKEDNLSHEGDAWVYDNATVCNNARISGNAWICDNAEVLQRAKVYDNAEVWGSAKVGGDAIVYGNARICNDAGVFDDATIYGNARIYDNVSIYDAAEVCGNAYIHGTSKIYMYARVYGDAAIYDNVSIYDNAEVYGDTVITGRTSIGGWASLRNNRDIIWIGSVGSQNSTLTAYRTVDGKVEVTRGCFRGSPDEFEREVKETHGDNKYGKEYLILASFIGERFTNLL